MVSPIVHLDLAGKDAVTAKKLHTLVQQ